MKLWYRDLKAWPKEYMPSGWRTKLTDILATIILPVLSALSLKLESYDKVMGGHASLLMVGVKMG
jgi:hypothetical protein